MYVGLPHGIVAKNFLLVVLFLGERHASLLYAKGEKNGSIEAHFLSNEIIHTAVMTATLILPKQKKTSTAAHVNYFGCVGFYNLHVTDLNSFLSTRQELMIFPEDFTEYEQGTQVGRCSILI